MTDTVPTPSGCRHCGIEAHTHFQRWTPEAGWHGWTAPTNAQVLARMRARRHTTTPQEEQ